jgi:hypothetical protein
MSPDAQDAHKNNSEERDPEEMIRIPIHLGVANRLKSMARVGETYTTIIQKLLDRWDSEEGKKA